MKKYCTIKHCVSFFLWIALLIGLFIYTFSGKKQLIFLTYSQKATVGQVSWKYDNKENADNKSVSFPMLEQLFQTIRIDLPNDISQIDSFIIVPASVSGNSFNISYVQLKKRGFKPVNIDLKTIKPIQGISNVSISNVLNFTTTTEIPKLGFEKPELRFRFDWLMFLIMFLVSGLIFATVFFSWEYFRNASYNFNSLLIVICLSVVITITFFMSIGAGFNASPDERDHFLAAEYYKTNSITPLRNAASGAYTYNPLWAYSRVYLTSVDYLLAGKFSNLFDSKAETYKSVRFFGIFLILIFLLLTVRLPKYSIVLIPFLFTPQTWYLFSYLNDGSLPLFLSFILIILTEAFKNKLVEVNLNLKTVIAILLLGSIYGLMIISKQNYLVFTTFYLIYIFTLPLKVTGNLSDDFKNLIRVLKRFIKIPIAIFVVALCIVGAREITIDRSQNDKLSAGTEEYYKQSKINFENHRATGISGRDRFKSYSKMIGPWISSSFLSSYGVYGFMKYGGSKFYYRFILILNLIIILGFIALIFFKRDYELAFWAVIFIISLLAMIFASSYLYSYRYDYQPQGKYLLPVLPILGLFFLKVKEKYRGKFFNALFLPLFITLFLMSVYSFIFVGFYSLCFL